MQVWQAALDKLKDYKIQKGVVSALWLVSKLLLLAVFINDAMRSIVFLKSNPEPITTVHNFGILMYTLLCFGGSLLVLLPKFTLVGSALLTLNLVAQFLYHLTTSASWNPGFEAISILGCILMLSSAQIHTVLEESHKNSDLILCGGLGCGMPGLNSREGMLALAQVLARIGFSVISFGHGYMSFALTGSVAMVFFNSAVLVPVLIGLYTRCFAILMGAVMWIGFYVNHFSLLKVDYFLAEDYMWFKFAQTTSITGGLLMLALQGPGSYSVDAARKKED